MNDKKPQKPRDEIGKDVNDPNADSIERSADESADRSHPDPSGWNRLTNRCLITAFANVAEPNK